jgi:uncharacterized protein (DUF2252 family)
LVDMRARRRHSFPDILATRPATARLAASLFKSHSNGAGNEQGKSRIADLLPVRYARMKTDPFAFLRGAAAIMAADLASGPTTGLRTQACGDCHLANFGGYASPEGTPVFDVNDFDETRISTGSARLAGAFHSGTRLRHSAPFARRSSSRGADCP